MGIFTASDISNVFVQLIAHLNVPYTKSYALQYYNEHPYKNTLFGLSKMLLAYKVDNVGLRLNDKGELYALEVPFIAQLNKDFAIVYKIVPGYISYWLREKNITVTFAEFINGWDGVVLIPEVCENSIEPDYRKHRKQEFFNFLEKYLLLFVIFLGAALSCIKHKGFVDIGYGVVFVLNLMGGYIGYLLLLKQLHIQNDKADKLCSLFKKGDCNSVLESPAAKLWGIIGWSEVGFAYFLSNLWIILFVPALMPYLVWINICALPYSFWSVWYQKVKAKQWCAMCLLVQVLLWTVFLSNLLFGFIKIPAFTFTEIMEVAIIYLVPFLAINLSVPILADGRKGQRLTQEISSLRMRNDVFLSLLKQCSYCKVDRSVSKVMFGNPDAKLLITILTNPHCNPCGKMHARVKRLLENCGKDICVQYVFSSFNEKVESSAQKLIAIYLHGNEQLTEKAFDEWFKDGKFKREVFFKKYAYDIDTAEVKVEYQKHIEWKKTNALNFTPLVFINGYEIPKGYQIEDIAYFTDLVVDSQ